MAEKKDPTIVESGDHWSPDVLDEARLLVLRHPVVDAHADFAWRHLEEDADFVSGRNCKQISLSQWQAANVRLQGAALFTPKEHTGEAATAYLRRMLDYVEGSVAARPDDLALIRSKADLAAHDLTSLHSRKVGLIPWIEGVAPLAGSFERFDEFVARGVKGIGLTHNVANEAGDGCFVEEATGLTDFGSELVIRMQEQGITLDLAHLSRAAFWQIVRIVWRPMVCTHTGIDAKVKSPRNLDDQQLHAIADTGGVIGVDFYPGHVGRVGKTGKTRGTVRDVFTVIDYIVELVGDDHVALGSDFDGFSDDCVDLESIVQLPNLVAEMLGRGYTEERIRKILGANWLRVLDATW
ncbi:MAG: dipeptidase [Planctomycetota bacterium]